MNRLSAKSLVIVSLGILVFTIAACVPIAAPAPAPTTPANAITDIAWHWISVTNKTTKESTEVLEPQNYTITFLDDGALTGMADCNSFTGMYSQDLGFTITLEATTMATCGDDSLDQQYLELLSAIAAGGPDGAGGLALETAGGEQRMQFENNE